MTTVAFRKCADVYLYIMLLGRQAYGVSRFCFDHVTTRVLWSRSLREHLGSLSSRRSLRRGPQPHHYLTVSPGHEGYIRKENRTDTSKRRDTNRKLVRSDFGRKARPYRSVS